jgi:hypothetical protein
MGRRDALLKSQNPSLNARQNLPAKCRVKTDRPYCLVTSEPASVILPFTSSVWILSF